MSIAAQVWERLEASGRRIHFRVEPGSRRTRVELHDLSGNIVAPLSASEALALASGASFNFAGQGSPLRHRTGE